MIGEKPAEAGNSETGAGIRLYHAVKRRDNEDGEHEGHGKTDANPTGSYDRSRMGGEVTAEWV